MDRELSLAEEDVDDQIITLHAWDISKRLTQLGIRALKKKIAKAHMRLFSFDLVLLLLGNLIQWQRMHARHASI